MPRCVGQAGELDVSIAFVTHKNEAKYILLSGNLSGDFDAALPRQAQNS